jgi:YkoY family integral membrane protein
MYGQSFEPHDLALVGLLVVLEGVLSIDNALVLGLLAKRLPKDQQSKALTYGLIGAFVFRLIAIGTAAYLLHWRIVKLLGGGYLLYVSAKHFFFESKEQVDEKIAVGADGAPTLVRSDTGAELTPAEREPEIEGRSPIPAIGAGAVAAVADGVALFWPTVFVIEMTDIAFAVDSIVAAIGVVGPPPPEAVRHPKLWVVLIGGFLGVILMRFAAVIFIKLLERFPRFETAAYLLVIVIGGKLVADWAVNTPAHPHALDFHSPRTVAFWVFWMLMILCFFIGFVPKTQPVPATSAGTSADT